MLGESLFCEAEMDNIHDPYAVAVLRSTTSGSFMSGHMPRTISTVFHFLLRRGWKHYLPGKTANAVF